MYPNVMIVACTDIAVGVDYVSSRNCSRRFDILGFLVGTLLMLGLLPLLEFS